MAVPDCEANYDVSRPEALRLLPLGIGLIGRFFACPPLPLDNCVVSGRYGSLLPALFLKQLCQLDIEREFGFNHTLQRTR